MKKFFLLFVLFFFLFGFFGFVIAQDPEKPKPLEVTYPKIEGIKPTTVETSVPVYIKYIYYFIVGIGGLIALGALIYGGIRWSTSAGNPEALKDAKDQILAAALGLLILLSSWLILYNINPELITLRLPPLKPIIPPQFSGILLCKTTVPIGEYFDQRQRAEELSKQFEEATNEETKKRLKDEIDQIKKKLDEYYTEIRKECYLVGGKGNLPDEWDNKIKQGTGQVYIIPTKYLVQEGTTMKEILKGYGILLFEDRKFEDDIQWIETGFPTSPRPYLPVSVKIKDISSVIPYVLLKVDEIGERKVTVYEEVNMNIGAEDKKSQEINYPDPPCSDLPCCGISLNFSPRSLDIEAEGKTLVVLSEGEKTIGLIYNGHVFIKDEPNLLKYSRISTTNPLKCPPQEIIRGGCPTAKKISVTFGQIY